MTELTLDEFDVGIYTLKPIADVTSDDQNRTTSNALNWVDGITPEITCANLGIEQDPDYASVMWAVYNGDDWVGSYTVFNIQDDGLSSVSARFFPGLQSLRPVAQTAVNNSIVDCLLANGIPGSGKSISKLIFNRHAVSLERPVDVVVDLYVAGLAAGGRVLSPTPIGVNLLEVEITATV